MMNVEGDMLVARVLKSFGLSYAVLKARAEELYDSIDASDALGSTPPPSRYPEAIEDPVGGAIPQAELEEREEDL